MIQLVRYGEDFLWDLKGSYSADWLDPHYALRADVGRGGYEEGYRKKCFAAWQEAWERMPVEDRRHPVLSPWRMYPFQGLYCFGLLVDGSEVSFAAYRFSTAPRKNAWGRYINFRLAFTPKDHRQQGYATLMAFAIRQLALARGYDRLKSVRSDLCGIPSSQNTGP